MLRPGLLKLEAIKEWTHRSDRHMRLVHILLTESGAQNTMAHILWCPEKVIEANECWEKLVLYQQPLAQ